jgi:acyl-CoA reductase-like NAD-dependent aldehyde dehydrogenase
MTPKAFLIGGDPRERETVIGPMIAPEAVQKVAKWVDQAVAAGAKLAMYRINGTPSVSPAAGNS